MEGGSFYEIRIFLKEIIVIMNHEFWRGDTGGGGGRGEWKTPGVPLPPIYETYALLKRSWKCFGFMKKKSRVQKLKFQE